MIALYSGKYTTEDLATLSAALEIALTHFSGCPPGIVPHAHISALVET